MAVALHSSLPIDKKGLLTWAERASGVVPCARLRHLADGLVLLGLCQCLYPRDVRRERVTARYRSKQHTERNWSLVRRCVQHHGLPAVFISQDAIARADESACLQALVLFHFLVHLSKADDFTVDYAFAVDRRLARFLQSPASLSLVEKYQHSRSSHTHATRSRLSSSSSSSSSLSSSSTVSSGGGLPSREEPRRARDGLVSEASRPLHARHARPPSAARSRDLSTASDPASREMDFADAAAAARSQSRAHRRRGASRSGRSVYNRSATRGRHDAVSLSAAAFPQPEGLSSASSVVDSDAAALRTECALLREELTYVRAVCSLSVLQQRGQLAAELARATASADAARAELRLAHAHDLRNAQLCASSFLSLSSTDPQPRLPTRTLEEQELARRDTVQADELATAQQRLRDFTAAMANVFSTMLRITGAALDDSDSTATTDSRSAAAYERAIADAFLTEARGRVDRVLQEGLATTLHVLLTRLAQLRASNERLRHTRHDDDAGDSAAPSPGSAVSSRVEQPAVGESARGGGADGVSGAMEAALREQCATIAQLRRECRHWKEAAGGAGASDNAGSRSTRVVVGPGARQLASGPSSAPPAASSASVTTSGVDAAHPDALSATPTGLLSLEELEKRKAAIMQRCAALSTFDGGGIASGGAPTS